MAGDVLYNNNNERASIMNEYYINICDQLNLETNHMQQKIGIIRPKTY